MNRILFEAMAMIAVAISSSGCSKEICEEAFDKLAACVDSMSCNRLDPNEREQCEKAKQLRRDANETLFKIGCDESEAQKVIDCRLDPNSCTCP